MKELLIQSVSRGFILSSLFVLVFGCEDSAEEIYKSSLQNISVEEGMDFYFYCNAPIATPQNTGQYQNLLVFVHGGALDGAKHFGAATEAVKKAGLSANTLVLAPEYQMSNSRNNYYWTKWSWKDGRRSINAVPKISSYAVFDSLIMDHVLKAYDQIETVVIAGHSAGGQFVYRYAALSQLPDLVSQEIIYLPMNPSSVIYLGPERWNKSKNRWEVPLNGPSCPGYDQWIFGSSDIPMNEYNRQLSGAEIRASFPWRNVVIGSGTEDLGGDADCEDLYQGANRRERAVNAFNYMTTFYPGSFHEKIDVVGVDHDRDRMIQSREIIDFLSEVFD